MNNNKLYSNKKNILSFIIILFCLFLFFLSLNTIPNTPTPLSNSGYKAYFYISDGSDDLQYIGTGLITEKVSVDNNAEYTSSLILSEPNLSIIISEKQYVEWSSIIYSQKKYRVIGYIRNNDDFSEETPITTVTTQTKALSSLTFDTVDLLKQADLHIGDVVSTLGYYSVGDGGAANYIITNKTNAISSFLFIPLNNGLFASLQFDNGLITVEQLGAYGDGIHDDVFALQQAIDSGLNVALTPNKTYKLISNGLYISKETTIYGNGATIICDDSFAPSKSDFDHHLIRNIYGNELNSFFLYDANILINFSDGKYIDKTFYAISPLLIDNICFDNITVQTNMTNNQIVCIWVDNGCESFTLSNSRLINNTFGKEGSALWLTSKKNQTLSKFQALNNCIIENSYIFSSSADDVLGAWGKSDINLIVRDTTIEGKITAQGRTRIISLVSQGDNSCTINANFEKCNIISNCDTTNKDSYYDSLLGIGTDNISNTINATFNNCDLDATVYGSLIFTSGYRDTSVSQFDANKKNVTITFNDSNIICSSTITGSYQSYFNTAANYPSYAWDCSFNSCSIQCNNAFAYLYVPTSGNYYIPTFELNGCNVQINNAHSFICKSIENAEYILSLINTNIESDNDINLSSVFINTQRTVNTQKNVNLKIDIQNSEINSRIIN